VAQFTNLVFLWSCEMRAEFLGVPVDILSLTETVDLADKSMTSRQRCQHVALNVAKLVKMRRQAELWRDVVESDIVGIDGMGILWGCRLLGLKADERVAGIDLFKEVLGLCCRKQFRPFFLGATDAVLQKMIFNLRKEFPNLQIAGYHHGYFAAQEDGRLVQQIRSSGADCLFLGLPTPRKERLLARYKDEFGVPFIMGVGGSFDVLAGEVSRAPPWMQRAGLEWFYRFYQEPRRMFWRYFSTNISFANLLTKELAGRALKSFR
jgi:N-acetylglucosaminyldiphosphoundecaprenol N-acetyl-beta-D-mannosaminyltransferase